LTIVMIRLEALSNDHLPWSHYNIFQDAEKVGQCAFKALPKNGKVEMAYYVFEPFQGQGIATEVCRLLTALSVAADPGVAVTARTLMEENASVQVARKNNYVFAGIVTDPEDGEVWEWVYRG